MEEGYMLFDSAGKEGFMYYFLAGIDYLNFGGVDLGRWLLGIVFILFGAALLLNARRQIVPFEMVRFGSRKQWWNTQFWNLFLVGMAGCFVFAFCMMGLDCLFGKDRPEGMEEVLILLLWQVHVMVIVSMFVLLYLTRMRTAAVAMLLAAEVASFIAGFYLRDLSKYMFGCWGMYMRSNAEDKNFGFSPGAVLMLECGIILGAWEIGVKVVERRDVNV